MIQDAHWCTVFRRKVRFDYENRCEILATGRTRMRRTKHGQPETAYELHCPVHNCKFWSITQHAKRIYERLLEDNP